MADPALMRAGLAANLSALNGVQVNAYVLANPTPPCVYVSSGPVEYDETMGRGHDTWTFIVYALVGYVSDIGAQKRLDEMLASHGAQSVKTLIESDRTLDGAAYTLTVPSVTGVRVYTLETGAGATIPPAIGAEWTVQVLASGTG